MATMTVERAGGLLSVDMRIGPVQKSFWSVSIRRPMAGGGHGPWQRIKTFDDKSAGNPNQSVDIDDCDTLIGSQIAIIFFVMRLNFGQADPYRVLARFACAAGTPISGGERSDSGSLAQTHVIRQFDFEVAAP